MNPGFGFIYEKEVKIEPSEDWTKTPQKVICSLYYLDML